MNEPIHYPLLFNFREAVSGNGFLAGVTVSGGRAVMLSEDGEWWMYGVRPAGLAETGETPQETFLRFMARLKAVLFDIASETSTFEEFRAEVERFLNEGNDEEEKRWNTAQLQLKSGTVTPEAPFLSSLPKEAPETRPTSMGILRLDGTASEQRFSSNDNVDTTPRLAA